MDNINKVTTHDLPTENGSVEICITVADPAWDSLVPDCRDQVLEAATAAAANRSASGDAEISILLTADKNVQELNRRYRGIDAPTNVLAFADGTPPPGAGAVGLLGDVVVALETTREEAEAGGLDIAEHLAHLVIHGVLHLLGYDHQTDDDAEAMERLETTILDGIGIADPYGGD
jgi:probable rRNA maturation factor